MRGFYNLRRRSKKTVRSPYEHLLVWALNEDDVDFLLNDVLPSLRSGLVKDDYIREIRQGLIDAQEALWPMNDDE